MAKQAGTQMTNSTPLLQILQARFEKNMHRHAKLQWEKVLTALHKNSKALEILNWMEETGGEPDVVVFDADDKDFYFVDCSIESPARRSLCYDDSALKARKENKPKGSAMQIAAELGVELLSEEQYQFMQGIDRFDLKTSSWLKTPVELRKLGGALFGDRRYNRCFIYHNGAESYYAARGFRVLLQC